MWGRRVASDNEANFKESFEVKVTERLSSRLPVHQQSACQVACQSVR